MNNRELFIRWYAWSLKYKDIDPPVWMTRYLNNRFEHNSEQTLWLSWLYGTTYQLPTAWIMFQEFPDFELADLDRVTAWNTKNYSKLHYQTDTKWNKGHLPDMLHSYQDFIGAKSQREALMGYAGDNETQTYENISHAVQAGLHKFGRYCTWFYLQHLKETAGIPLEPTSLLLNDYSGSRSHRNGLLHVIDKTDWIDDRLTPAEYKSLEDEAKSILDEVKARYPEYSDDIDFFTMETALCSFKKIFRDNNYRYLGYYLDRQVEDIKKCEADDWWGIDWDVLWQARSETLDSRLLTRVGVDYSNHAPYTKTGAIERLDWMFETEDKPQLSAFFV